MYSDSHFIYLMLLLQNVNEVNSKLAFKRRLIVRDLTRLNGLVTLQFNFFLKSNHFHEKYYVNSLSGHVSVIYLHVRESPTATSARYLK